MAGGAAVRAWDDGEAGRLKAVEQGVALEDLTRADWSGFDALILSPGVRLRIQSLTGPLSAPGRVE